MTSRLHFRALGVALLLLPAVAVRRVVVAGDSMMPAFRAGDRLVVVRGLPLREGRVVALRDPRDGSRLLVKRVASVTSAGIEVRGDNEAASTDSREFGPVRRDRILGTAVYRYAPPDRTGRLVCA